ncbi:hypothetical protein NS115_02545 [Paenibacillus jamilae]|uniref:Uncharacterized protein n=1 Tax=Paenibacillus jamilae TaxID=114136 RepID=A0ACC5A024_9BACL|nr:hypothetical protein C0638_22410 [Paenibacillus sp. lzh-N1]KTS84573.1 hypothetical protein NS115_02545 [Paenibacillus jamilae]
MLMRKMMICTSLFILLLIVGWGLEHNIHTKIAMSQMLPAVESYKFRSAHFTEPVLISIPFLPREYVRIVRKINE